jgi:tRNA(fMet)-specific endonuclease VapC
VKYLLDTNICIYIINEKLPALLRRMQRFTPGELGISAITVAELEYGIHKSTRPERNRIALTSFLLPFEIIDFDQAAATEYGEIRAWQTRHGKIVGALDLLIAAQARSRGLVLVTNNEKEFSLIPGLQMENWATG